MGANQTSSIETHLRSAAERLSTHSESARLDAQVLLSHILKQPRTWLVAHLDLMLADDQETLFEQQLRRLEKGEPLPYVIGHWEFFGLDFEVTPEVLIPRPETELLVERALSWRKVQRESAQAWDAGTGTGCIAVSVAVHDPGVHFICTDLSFSALQAAKRNASRYVASGQIDFIQADLCTPFPLSGATRFDLVTANLPYIPTDTLVELDVYQKEPVLALDGGRLGTRLIRCLLEQLPGVLKPGGLALLEIEASLGPVVLGLARDAFPQAAINLHQDLAGHDRLLEIKNLFL